MRYEARARISGLGDHIEVEVGKLECQRGCQDDGVIGVGIEVGADGN